MLPSGLVRAGDTWYCLICNRIINLQGKCTLNLHDENNRYDYHVHRKCWQNFRFEKLERA